MGLLDDAIREHLELKRTRGADAGEVLREEREALGASGGPETPDSGAVAREDEPFTDGVFDAAAETAADVADEPDVQFSETTEADVEAAPVEPSREPPTEADDDDQVTSDPGHIALEQETAEVDMKAMLGVDGDEDVIGPIEERLGYEQEISAVQDEDEPWGAPPEPTGG
jgi:hypothetical protein